MAEGFERCWPLADIEVMRSGAGDGRTVKAYASVFDVPAEIRDQHGHYLEVIDPGAFRATLAKGFDRVGVYFHHGLTLHGTPSDLGSVPIGRPVSIKADRRGLLTVSRFNRSTLADSVLSSIENGDITGYSFRGGIFRSSPSTVPRRRVGADLPTVRRLEMGLVEYGPTPTPVYPDAAILAVRSAEEEAAHRGFRSWALHREVQTRRAAGQVISDDPLSPPVPDVGLERLAEQAAAEEMAALLGVLDKAAEAARSRRNRVYVDEVVGRVREQEVLRRRRALLRLRAAARDRGI